MRSIPHNARHPRTISTSLNSWTFILKSYRNHYLAQFRLTLEYIKEVQYEKYRRQIRVKFYQGEITVFPNCQHIPL